MKKIALISILFTTTAFSTHLAKAHGVVGERIFPATLATEDPFTADELMLPQVQASNMKDDGTNMWQTMTMGEYSKTITKDFAISVAANHLINDTSTGTKQGFDNFEISAGYQLIKNSEHEFALLSKLDWDIGNSGSKQVSAEKYSTFTPSLIFGKGLGDLPDSMEYLKPFAVTGSFGIGLPTEHFTTSVNDDGDIESTRNASNIKWGGTIQYSIPYLQQHVKNIGLGEFTGNLIPIVEFSMETPTDGINKGKTNGSINPGIIWSGKTMQFGLEAVIPANSDSGHGTGVIGQVHFYLDNLLPNSLGKPIFGN